MNEWPDAASRMPVANVRHWVVAVVAVVAAPGGATWLPAAAALQVTRLPGIVLRDTYGTPCTRHSPTPDRRFRASAIGVEINDPKSTGSLQEGGHVRIGIVGAGIAGLSCATLLVEAGHAVVLFDKGRRPGGRMSTRRLMTSLGEIGFDHGAQYLTARDPTFVAQIERWASSGDVARWAPAGDDAWVGTPGMNAPLRDLASRLNVHWECRVETLTQTPQGWILHGGGIDAAPFDGAIIAVPAEQVVSLVEAHRTDWAGQARATRSDPCWTVMAAYKERLPIKRDRLTDLGIIASAVRNSAKPGRGDAEAWVLQATGHWSAENIENEPEEIERAVLTGFAAAAGQDVPSPIATSVHRWRYAKSGSLGHDALWDGSRRLGLCGDWLLGGRVEAAWLSGRRLAQTVIAA